MKTRFYLIFAASLAPLIAAGCSGSNTPAVAKVSGAVTYHGQPVDSATVVFAPEGGGKPSTGVTDAQGRYELSTFGDRDGAPPGTFSVTVTKTKTEGGTTNLTQEQMNEMVLRGQPLPTPVITNLLPEKYFSPATSGLVKTVQKGSNDIPIQLTD